MANIAKEVTKLNGFPQIQVINKHSTNVTVGENGDMKVRKNHLHAEMACNEKLSLNPKVIWLTNTVQIS